MRQPGIEPGPHRWQRRILTVELLARTLHIYIYIYNKICYLTGRTRTSDLGMSASGAITVPRSSN